jgi:anti-sigma-K factor RskA
VRLVLVAVLALAGCATYAQRQAAERPPCRDVALALIVAECRERINATPNATEKNAIRKECLARVDAWEKCQ